MNVVIRSILSLAVIYVLFFNFDTSPIKYLLALAWTYPVRAIIVTVIAAGVVICASKTYQFMRREADSVKRFSERWAMAGVSDAHSLLKARKLLRERNIFAKDDEAILKDLLVRYRKIYDALPDRMKAKQIIGESIPDKHINLAIKSVRDWADGKGEIHNADGYGGVGTWETNEKGSSWFLPLPLGDQYRSIIRDNLQLNGLL